MLIMRSGHSYVISKTMPTLHLPVAAYLYPCNGMKDGLACHGIVQRVSAFYSAAGLQYVYLILPKCSRTDGCYLRGDYVDG